MKPLAMIQIFRRFGGRSCVHTGSIFRDFLMYVHCSTNLLCDLAGISYRKVGWKCSDGIWRRVILSP